MGKRKTSGDVAMNVIIAVVIIAVLGLGVWAVAPKISEGVKNRASSSQSDNTQQSSATLGDMAAAEGISFDEYIEKYGLKDAGLTAEDDYQSALYEMTVENFAKATGTTAEEIMSEYKLPASVTADTKWGEAQLEMPAGVALGGDDKFEQAKATYGLGDEFTAESRWGDVQNAMIQKMIQQQAAAASAAPEGSAAPEVASDAESTAAPEATAAADNTSKE